MVSIELFFKNDDYKKWLEEIKTTIRSAQAKTITQVNQELIIMYWNIGNSILEKQNELGWGAKVIDKLSEDLKSEIPDVKGFSVRNLKYMAKFASTYEDIKFVQQVVALIPWGHNCILIDKISDNNERFYYIQKTIENNWSRNILVHQIESDLYQRQGKSITNFKETLPQHLSNLAQNTLKDPYIFDFLSIGNEYSERILELDLLKNVEKFLLELGAGFAFVGRQLDLC